MGKGDFTAYMDGIAFFYERGDPCNGNRVFSDLDSLKQHLPCVKSGECGIVEVEVRLKRIVEPGQYIPPDPDWIWTG